MFVKDEFLAIRMNKKLLGVTGSLGWYRIRADVDCRGPIFICTNGRRQSCYFYIQGSTFSQFQAQDLALRGWQLAVITPDQGANYAFAGFQRNQGWSGRRLDLRLVDIFQIDEFFLFIQ